MTDLNIHDLVQMPLTVEQREIIRESARKCLKELDTDLDGGYVVITVPEGGGGIDGTR